MLNICVKRICFHPVTMHLLRRIHTTPIKSGTTAWVYRRAPLPAPAYIERYADIVGTVMWYWILYHCMTQYEHITGEFEYPNPAKWTDEELGIPPDDEE